jgi:hypothetical protein
MRRICALSLLLLASAYCGWTTTFAIVNLSVERIRITYTVRRLRITPAVKATRDLSHSDRPWTPLAVPPLRPDTVATLTFELGPDSAVRITTWGTYSGTGEGDNDWFEVTSLTIQAPRGERSYRAGEVLKAFVKRSRTMYAVDYR